ncbi:preprotein translocase subunit SecG [Limibacter armeniacum]|uniref:preprotein translocase subunit SecG n=1 Tax=Limibacter armeniacum TaxID=466084 RepID=UPI002FE54B3F
MVTFFIVVIMIVAVLLILLVLAQDSKGGGLTGNVSSASQLMGARRTTDWIEKATWILAATMFVLSIGVNLFSGTEVATEGPVSPTIESASDVAPVAAPELEAVEADSAQ